MGGASKKEKIDKNLGDEKVHELKSGAKMVVNKKKKQSDKLSSDLVIVKQNWLKQYWYVENSRVLSFSPFYIHHSRHKIMFYKLRKVVSRVGVLKNK